MKKWFYDISSNYDVVLREDDSDQANYGDYHHSEWVGPFDTFTQAKREGLTELRFRFRAVQRGLKEFSDRRKPK